MPMAEHSGDIFALSNFLRDEIVIPTNPGWTKAGRNVMGRGLALQARKRFPGVDEWYGEFCMQHKGHPPVCRERFSGLRGARTLIFAPTKPFNEAQHWMSWQGKSDLTVIEQSLRELATYVPKLEGGKIWVPLLGCGNGGLQRDTVRELMDRYLTAAHFVRVRWEH